MAGSALKALFLKTLNIVFCAEYECLLARSRSYGEALSLKPDGLSHFSDLSPRFPHLYRIVISYGTVSLTNLVTQQKCSVFHYGAQLEMWEDLYRKP